MTGPSKIQFVVPVFNQLHFTRQCLDSLAQDGIPRQDIVVVDNASTDGTREFLAATKGLRVISNEVNRGCSVAWNQGVETVLAAGAEWVVVINNDVIVAKGFVEGLRGFADVSGTDIVHPATGEGEMDYDFPAFAAEFVGKMRRLSRSDDGGGDCFMVRRAVFERVGLFDTTFGLAGFEDVDFFRRARKAGFRRAISGMAYLHHFGSVTQKSVKASLGMAKRTGLASRAAYRKKHGLNWFRRRVERYLKAVRVATCVRHESRDTGFSLRMRRSGGRWNLA